MRACSRRGAILKAQKLPDKNVLFQFVEVTVLSIPNFILILPEDILTKGNEADVGGLGA